MDDVWDVAGNPDAIVDVIVVADRDSEWLVFLIKLAISKMGCTHSRSTFGSILYQQSKTCSASDR